jgi:4,5-dihydroxyphthalate decarboxylase
LRRSGLYPINHLIVVRNDLLDAHPDLAADVFGAFAEAKNRYVERLRRDDIENPTPADRMYRRVMAITGADPMPYGIAPNRAMIDQLIRHVVSQQILDRPPAVEMLFPESTHNLTA